MHFSLKTISAEVAPKAVAQRMAILASCFAVSAASMMATLPTAKAESAYIQQAPAIQQAYTESAEKMLLSQGSANGGIVNAQRTAVSLTPTPELATPHVNPTNFARSITVGNFNTVTQIQTGQNDLSSAAVLGGNHDNVGVVQAGNNLQSNIALLGLQSQNVLVLQGQNSAPVNLFIARLPNGTILMK